LRVGVADQIGYFRAYNTDGSAKTDLTSSTTGLTLSVFRVGAAAVSISSLSAKAADDAAHADGAIRAVSGNLYTVDLPDAACADQVPSISVKGSYTGGVIEGPEHPLVGYNPASVAVGANTTTPPTVGAIADQVWDEARSGHVTAGTFGEKVAAELDSASVDAIWNEVLTGATHNIASSAGRRLRQLADTVVLVDGVCDAASNAGTDSTGTITLEVGTTTACIGQAIRSENQVRFIAAYDAGTRVAQLDRPWCVVPDAGDEYVIFNVRNPLVGLASLALAGSTAAVVNDVLVDTGTTLPAQIAPITDGIGWTLASLYGACANPQAADSLVQLTINGHDYSGQYSGLTATGVRTAPTLSKV
jgi:hypothetical protein